VAQDQLSRVAEDPLLLLVVLPPIEAAALRMPTLVVVVLLQLVVDSPVFQLLSVGAMRSSSFVLGT
jgi:hypothetical protein